MLPHQPRFSLSTCSIHASRRPRRWNRQPRNAVEDRGKQPPRDRHLGQLERDVFGVSGDLGSDLHQSLAQCRQRPVLNVAGQCQGHKIDMSVGAQYYKLSDADSQRFMTMVSFDTGESAADADN